jgi:hypothetical protein
MGREWASRAETTPLGALPDRRRTPTIERMGEPTSVTIGTRRFGLPDGATPRQQGEWVLWVEDPGKTIGPRPVPAELHFPEGDRRGIAVLEKHREGHGRCLAILTVTLDPA